MHRCFSFVQLESWPFCTALDDEDPCQEQVGAFIDLGIRIEGAEQGGVVLELSNEVSVDGSWEDLPTGYPIISSISKDKNELYTFRFPKFASSMIYDPIIHLDLAVEVSNDASSQTFLAAVALEGAREIKSAASSQTFLVAVALAVCVGFFVWVKKRAKKHELTSDGKADQPFNLRAVITADETGASARIEKPHKALSTFQATNMDDEKAKARMTGKLADFDDMWLDGNQEPIAVEMRAR